MGEVGVVDKAVDDDRDEPHARGPGERLAPPRAGREPPRGYEARARGHGREGDADYTEAHPEIEHEVVRVRGEALAPGDRMHVLWQVCVEELVVAVPPQRPVGDHLQRRVPDREP